MREAEVKRKTNETDISCKITLDGKGKSNVTTKIGFFDHMLTALSKHSGFDLDFNCNGDIEVDCHHSVEDSGIVLGQAFDKALGDKAKIQRYANFVMPMDDALVLCAVDLCGRAYYQDDAYFNSPKVGDFETECTKEFFQSFAQNAKINLHFVVIRGENSHHIIEAMFKSLAKCLHDATRINDEIDGMLSTKGVI